MKNSEKSDKSKNELLQVSLRLFGTKGYDGTSIADIEEELQQTRGALIYHYKSKLKLFEAVIEKYYFSRIMPSSLDKQDRDTLNVLCSTLVLFMENECVKLKNLGIQNIAGVYINLENDALRYIPDFRERCKSLQQRELGVVEQTVRHSMDIGEIRNDVLPSVIAEMFMNVVRGQTYRANILGLDYYTDGMSRQFNGLYHLISKY